jgi:hypothetical protein
LNPYYPSSRAAVLALVRAIRDERDRLPPGAQLKRMRVYEEARLAGQSAQRAVEAAIRKTFVTPALDIAQAGHEFIKEIVASEVLT